MNTETISWAEAKNRHMQGEIHATTHSLQAVSNHGNAINIVGYRVKGGVPLRGLVDAWGLFLLNPTETVRIEYQRGGRATVAAKNLKFLVRAHVVPNNAEANQVANTETGLWRIVCASQSHKMRINILRASTPREALIRALNGAPEATTYACAVPEP